MLGIGYFILNFVLYKMSALTDNITYLETLRQDPQ